MRKTWIAVGMIALCVGLAAGYRFGRSGISGDEPVREAERPEPAPAGSVAQVGAPAPPGSPQVAQAAAPEPSAEQAVPRRRVWGYDLTSLSSAESKTAPVAAGAPGFADSPTAAPAPSETAKAPMTPVRGDKAVPPVAAAPAEAPKTDPAKAQGAPAPTDDPESDRQPPTLGFLRFDPPEIQDGGSATLSVGATDDLSGVKSVVGTLRSPSEAAVVPFVAQDAAGSGVFTASIAIPRQAETGDWVVRTLQIIDKANNPLNLAFSKPAIPVGGALRVASAESDSTAPTVRRVWVDKGTVSAGEKNQIVVEIDDDRSGVASVTGAFQSPSKSAYIAFGCRANGESSWVGDVVVPSSADCGEWTLQQLRVADKANNAVFLTMASPDIGRVSFEVAGGGACDSDPPVIDAVYVAPATVSNAAASEVALTFTVHDDGSGVAVLTGRVEGPVSAGGQVPRVFFTSQPDARNPEAPLTARIAVPQFAAAGIWRVTGVEVTDKAHNRRVYNRTDPALADAAFTVE